MRILLITNHFHPEEFRCNDLAFALAERGHKVTVLTAIPDYPQGKFPKGYGIFRKRIERVRGVKVLRSFIIPRGDGGKFRLMLNYGSSLLAQCWDALWLGLFGRYEYVLVHETSPVMVGVPGVIVSKLRRAPMDFWVLDLWPESLQDAGGVNNPKILGFFGGLTRWIYKHSRKILISSRGFRDSICEMGNFGGKLVYFPNWADVALGTPSTGSGTAAPAGELVELPALRQAQGPQGPAATGPSTGSGAAATSGTGMLPDGFRVMFAGNIGEAQDMEGLLGAALVLKEEKDIQFCIVGDGRKRPWVEEFVKEHGLEATVHLLGRHPIEAMPAFFASADVMLVTLKDSRIFNRTAPAKLQAYMNAGKPIAAMMNGEGASVIAEAGCGYSVAAGDSEAFAALLRRMRSLGPSDLAALGSRGKEYCSLHFDFARSVALIEELMGM